MQFTSVDGAVVAGVVVVVMVLLALRWRARRALARRLESLALRLEAPEADGENSGLESVLSRLERGAQRAAEKVENAATGVTRLGHALGAVPHGVVICDEHGDVVFRNGLAETFVSARHADALAEQAVLEVLEAARAGHSKARSLDLYGPPRRRLNVSGAPIDDGRRSIGAVAVIEDVSDRLRLESVRRDFVANVSHELKTPVGALGLLAETLAAEDDAAVTKRLAARMQIEAHRVAGIIDDLLDLSRIEAEESPVREPVPLHVVVGHAVERIRQSAEHRNIVLDVTEPPSRLQVLGDRRQLVSAVYNLLDNAVKYSPDESTVELTVRMDGRSAYLVVRDHGVGIPSRDLERIFERFYRVDRASGRDTGGTGLGLAIVRHVAQNHDGEVLVDSHEGEGSTFTLRLPALPGPVGVIGPAGVAGPVAEAG